mmetsp:Transcript_4150/g.12633  ORF Transcript_4150/g.12633 Transcript_4150/m.12633 type:complete len:208 (-) Transcript_4150:1723-2346(-)
MSSTLSRARRSTRSNVVPLVTSISARTFSLMSNMVSSMLEARERRQSPRSSFCTRLTTNSTAAFSCSDHELFRSTTNSEPELDSPPLNTLGLPTVPRRLPDDGARRVPPLRGDGVACRLGGVTAICPGGARERGTDCAGETSVRAAVPSSRTAVFGCPAEGVLLVAVLLLVLALVLALLADATLALWTCDCDCDRESDGGGTRREGI